MFLIKTGESKLLSTCCELSNDWTESDLIPPSRSYCARHIFPIKCFRRAKWLSRVLSKLLKNFDGFLDKNRALLLNDLRFDSFVPLVGDC